MSDRSRSSGASVTPQFERAVRPQISTRKLSTLSGSRRSCEGSRLVTLDGSRRPRSAPRAGSSEPIEKAGRNPDLLFYKLKTNAYKFSWMLIPLSVPFLWLLFPFSRRFRLYDHTVFVTYSLSFMTLLVVTAVLIGLAGLPQVAGFAMLIPPIHIYRQLKGTYGLSSGGALIRTVLLMAFATLALGLFLLMLFGLGLFD